MIRLGAAHFLINALLLWLGYYWLGVGESQTSTLLWSAFLAFSIAAITCCAYGAVLAYFGTSHQFVPAWRTAGKHLPAIFVAALLVGVIYWLLSLLEAKAVSDWALHLASYATLKSRRPMRPERVAQAFEVIFWILYWLILPGIFLPLVARVAALGWPGFVPRGFLRPANWLRVIAVLLATLWAPWKLLHWVPDMSSFALEAGSFVVRASVAYLLFVFGWLAAGFVASRGISGGSPRATQPSTVVSP